MVTSLKRASWAQGVMVEAQSPGVRGRKPMGCRVRRVHSSRGTHPSGSSHHQLLVMLSQEAESDGKRQEAGGRIQNKEMAAKKGDPECGLSGQGQVFTPCRSGH